MADIVCPECHGMYDYDRRLCATCGDDGTIPDRRKPSEIDALRAEVAALKNECESRKHYQELDGQAMRAANKELARRRAEIAALRDMYAGPLTDNQAQQLTDDLGATPFHWKQRDAAIRAAREGER